MAKTVKKTVRKDVYKRQDKRWRLVNIVEKVK